MSYFQKHFELTRKDESASKSQRAIDAARVNLGIAQANTMMEACKHMVLNDTQTLLHWKIKREMRVPTAQAAKWSWIYSLMLLLFWIIIIIFELNKYESR